MTFGTRLEALLGQRIPIVEGERCRGQQLARISRKLKYDRYLSISVPHFFTKTMLFLCAYHGLPLHGCSMMYLPATEDGDPFHYRIHGPLLRCFEALWFASPAQEYVRMLILDELIRLFNAFQVINTA